MKKSLFLSMLAVFFLTFTSCSKVDKKQEKGKKTSSPHHRRYHTE